MEVNDQLDIPGKETPLFLSLEAGYALESIEMLWREKKQVLSQPGFNLPPRTVHPAA
jgi:hypothetical protein